MEKDNSPNVKVFLNSDINKNDLFFDNNVDEARESDLKPSLDQKKRENKCIQCIKCGCKNAIKDSAT